MGTYGTELPVDECLTDFVGLSGTLGERISLSVYQERIGLKRTVTVESHCSHDLRL